MRLVANEPTRTFTIGVRFNGPPGSGNGGYAAGLMASAADRPLRVRLHKPIPLAVPLTLAENGTDAWQLLHGDDVLATGVAATVETEVPASPAFADAVTAAQRYPRAEDHDLPHCFVCGPARAPGDGMRIFAAAVAGAGIVAAPWVPDASLAETEQVRPEFIWAALDCPGAFASGSDKPMLLGEIAARVDRRPRIGEKCVVIGWPIAADGRKHKVGTAVYDGAGKLSAVALSTWIELKG